MQKLLLTFIQLLLFKLITCAQPIANSLVPEVDKRIELLSIIFMEAKKSNPADVENPVYAKAIHDHFDKYYNHPLIQRLRIIIDSLEKDSIDIGSWEIPSLAVHLSPPPALEPLVPLNDTSVRDGWDDRTLLTRDIIDLLHRFYKDTDCESFFRSQKSYYAAVNKHCENQLVKINAHWLENFFSVPVTERYYGIINLQGFGNGDYLRVNYKSNHRDTYTIFGCSKFDAKGLPGNFSNPLIARSNLHEYIHAFTNQLVDRNIITLQKPAETLLLNSQVSKLVANTFYGNWQFLLYESLVRSCSIKYLASQKALQANAIDEIKAQKNAGFLWIKGLVDQLNLYEANRKKYKNIEAFMPEIVSYFEKTAAVLKNDPDFFQKQQ